MCKSVIKNFLNEDVPIFLEHLQRKCKLADLDAANRITSECRLAADLDAAERITRALGEYDQ